MTTVYQATLKEPTPYHELGIKENEIWHSKDAQKILQFIKKGLFFMRHEFATSMDKTLNYQQISSALSSLKTEIRDQMRLQRAEYRARNEERDKITSERV